LHRNISMFHKKAVQITLDSGSVGTGATIFHSSACSVAFLQ